MPKKKPTYSDPTVDLPVGRKRRAAKARRKAERTAELDAAELEVEASAKEARTPPSRKGALQPIDLLAVIRRLLNLSYEDTEGKNRRGHTLVGQAFVRQLLAGAPWALKLWMAYEYGKPGTKLASAGAAQDELRSWLSGTDDTPPELAEQVLKKSARLRGANGKDLHQLLELLFAPPPAGTPQ